MKENLLLNLIFLKGVLGDGESGTENKQKNRN
jgi:hypothetical protein